MANHRVEKDIRLTTPDGAQLSTDIHHPCGEGPFPTVMQRTCYGKALLADHFGVAELVEAGYRVVFQDCRGSGESTGEPDLFAEAADGRFAADWIAAQDWFDGNLGTFGFSYMGFTQYALASTRPPFLKAMAIGLAGADRAAAWFPGGGFALDIAIPWAVIRTLGPVGAMEPDQAARTERAMAHLPLGEADRIATGETIGFYQQWMQHPSVDDPHWDALDSSDVLASGIPTLLVDGWFDYQIDAMISDRHELSRCGTPHRLVVGPWTHPAIDNDVWMRETIAWFDVHLKGQAPVGDGSGARIFVLPDRGFREVDTWPEPSTPLRLNLHADGVLSPDLSEESEPTPFVYDPADPTPSCGGRGMLIGGPEDNRELEARADVLTFTTEPWPADLEISGAAEAEVYLASDVGHFDVFARLCDVDSDGRSVNLSDKIVGIDPSTTEATTDGAIRVRIQLSAVAAVIAAGHRLRLQLSGGAFPLYARNTCSGESLADAQTLVVAHHHVHHDPARPSSLTLPVLA
jgi:putative CocE/NonD family hydrolase